MPANKRPRRLTYAVNQKGPKTWNKMQKAIDHYKKLKKREEKEWNTKWIENAFKVVLTKFKKYSINPEKI